MFSDFVLAVVLSILVKQGNRVDILKENLAGDCTPPGCNRLLIAWVFGLASKWLGTWGGSPPYDKINPTERATHERVVTERLPLQLTNLLGSHPQVCGKTDNQLLQAFACRDS